MAAQTEGRPYKRKFLLFSQAVALAAAEVFEGSLIAVTDATGYADAAADAAGTTVVGVAKTDKDNSAGAAGDESVVVEKGVFGFNNAAANSCDQADIGQTVYVVDDNTVGKAAATVNSIAAGTLLEIDDDGVCWVAVGMTL